jgi:hypothetical protein
MQLIVRLRLIPDASSLANIAFLGIYSQSQDMLVHVWETCRSSEGFRILKCNCSSLFPEVSEGSHSKGRCGIDLGRVSYLTGGRKLTHSTPTPQYMLSPPVYGYGYLTTQAYNVPTMYSSYAPPSQVPIYSANSYGMPVNVQHGAVLTEARGIFIQNLSYKCTLADFYSLLLTVGQPVDYRLIRDSRTGVFKGSATAAFGSQEQAQRAAYYLNRVQHMGMTLSVRMDKEATAVGQTAPLIVGSDMYVSTSRVRSVPVPY